MIVRVEQLEHPLGRCSTRLQEVGHTSDLRDGHLELTRVLDERLHVTQRHGTTGHPQAADHCDRDVVEVGDEHEGRLDEAGDELRLEAALGHLRVRIIEISDGCIAMAVYAHELMAREHLLHMAIELARPLPLGTEVRLRPLGDDHGDDEGQRDCQHRDERKDRADPDHHRQHANNGQHRGDQLRERLLQGHSDVVDVVGDPAQQVAARRGVEIAQRQTSELEVHLFAQSVHRALSDPGHEVVLPPRQHRREEVDDRDNREQPGKCCEVDPLTRGECHRRQHVGLRALPCTSKARNGLGLRDARRNLLRDHSGEDDVGGIAQQLGTEHGQEHARDAKDEDEDRHATLGAQAGSESAHGAAQVLGLLGRRDHVHARRAAAAHRAARSGRSAWSHHAHETCAASA